MFNNLNANKRLNQNNTFERLCEIQNTKKNNKKGTTIKLKENIPFPESIVNVSVLSIGEICKMFSTVLKQSIVGYVGCNADITSDYQIKVKIFIDPTAPDEKDSNKINLLLDKTTGAGNVFKELNNLRSSRFSGSYKLSEKGRSVLNDFKKSKSPDLVVTKENVTQKYVQISGLDFEKIVSKLFGRKNEQGDRLEYRIEITHLNDIRNQFAGRISASLVMISRYSESELNEIVKRVSYVPENSMGFDCI